MASDRGGVVVLQPCLHGGLLICKAISCYDRVPKQSLQLTLGNIQEFDLTPNAGLQHITCDSVE